MAKRLFTPTLRANKSGTYTLSLNDVPSDTVFSAALADLSQITSILEKGKGKLILERNPAFTEEQLVDALKPLVLALALRQTAPQAYSLKYVIVPGDNDSYTIELHMAADDRLLVDLMADHGIDPGSVQGSAARHRVEFRRRENYPVNELLATVQLYCDQFLARHS